MILAALSLASCSSDEAQHKRLNQAKGLVVSEFHITSTSEATKGRAHWMQFVAVTPLFKAAELRIFLQYVKIISQKFAAFKKNVYLCTRNPQTTGPVA